MKAFLLGFLLLFNLIASARDQSRGVLTLIAAIEKLESANLVLQNKNLEFKKIQDNKLGGLSKEPLSISFFYGNTQYSKDGYIFEARLPVGSIPAFLRYNDFHHQQIKLGEVEKELLVKDFTKELKIVYYQWLFADKKKKIHEYFLNIFNQSIPLLEDTIPENSEPSLKNLKIAMMINGILNEIKLLETETKKFGFQINKLIMEAGEWTPDHNTSEIYVIQFPGIKGDEFPGPRLVLDTYSEKLELEKEKTRLVKAELFPSLVLGAFKQNISPAIAFYGVYAGINIPVWEWISGSRQKNQSLNLIKAKNNFAYYEFAFKTIIDELINDLDGYHATLQYKYAYVLPYAHALRQNSVDRFFNQQIDYNEFLENLKNAMSIEISYLETLNKYNISAIELEYMVQ